MYIVDSNEHVLIAGADGMPSSAITREYERLIEAGDWDMAREMLVPLIEAGIAEAIYLGSMISLPKEGQAGFEARHVRQVREAAQLGYVPAIYTFGMFHLFGDGLPCDKAVAAHYFKIASDAGYPAAQYEYGLALLHGIGATEDRVEAMRLIRLSAEAGDETAQYFLEVNRDDYPA